MVSNVFIYFWSLMINYLSVNCSHVCVDNIKRSQLSISLTIQPTQYFFISIRFDCNTDYHTYRLQIGEWKNWRLIQSLARMRNFMIVLVSC